MFKGKEKFLLVLFLFLFSSGTLFSSAHGVGNGGKVIKIANEYLLYDFYEAGISDKVYIKQEIADEMAAESKVRSALMVNDFVISSVVSKLNEIYKKVPDFALMLLDIIENYQWPIISEPVIEVFDIGPSPIKNYRNLDFYTLAIRDDSLKVTTIFEDIWLTLRDEHKVGLIFHEAVYALLANVLGVKESYEARALNAVLFSPLFKFQSEEQLIEKIKVVGLDIEFSPASEYFAINSVEFKNECGAFKKRAMDFLKQALVPYNKAYIMLLEKMPGGQTDKSTSYKLPGAFTIMIDGEKMYTPVPSFTFPYKINGKKWVTDLGGILYFFTGEIPKKWVPTTLFKAGSSYKDLLKSVRNYQSEIDTYLEENEIEFLGQCLDSDIISMLDNYLAADANPVIEFPLAKEE